MEKRKLPIILENDFEKMAKSKEVLSVLEKLKLGQLVVDAKNRTKRKTGIRKTRTTKVKKMPRYLLIVVGNDAKSNAGRNLPGVDVVKVSELKVKHLAPGTHAGRVTIYTENALKEIGEKL